MSDFFDECVVVLYAFYRKIEFVTIKYKHMTEISNHLEMLKNYIDEKEQALSIDIIIYMVKAIEKNELTLSDIPHNLRHIREIFRVCVKQGNIKVVRDMAPSLAEDEKFILSLIKINPKCFEFLSAKCRDNAEITRVAVLTDHSMFQYASNRLKDDITMVHIALHANPSTFQCVSDRLKRTIEIAQIAVCADLSIFEHIDITLKNDINFRRTVLKIILESTKSKPQMSYIDAHYTDIYYDCATRMKKLIFLIPYAFFLASDRLRADKAFLREVLKLRPKLLINIDPKMWNDFADLF